MHPYFDFFGYTISGYALMGLIGFGVTIVFTLLKSRRTNFSFDDAIYLLVLSMIGMIIGAKVLYIVTVVPDIVSNWSSISEDPLTYLRAYLSGGMVFYGGLLGGLLGAKASAAFFKIPLAEHYDVFVPAIPLFAGFGRLGCLTEGCCYGKETSHLPYIVFHESLFAPNGVPLIPTQLYEAAFDFILFGVLLGLSSKKEWVPNLLAVYLAAYAAFRFMIEFFRGDTYRGIFLLSTSQWISLAILCVLAVRQMRTRVRRISAGIRS